MMRLRMLTLALGASLSSGCATLIPDYFRPASPAPDEFPQAEVVAGKELAYTIPWREYFTDPRLREVIAQALENNRDLRVAALNIERARAQYRIQRADLFPSISADASETAQRLPEDLTNTGRGETERQYSATLGFSAWELDFFGRIRSLNEQAIEQYLATEEARRSLQITLIGDIAQAWMTLAADRERLALAQRTYETRVQSHALTLRSFEHGTVSALDVHQSETLLETARADQARLQSVVNMDKNALALLVGAPLREEWLPATMEETAAAVERLKAGVPSEVLLQRPDVLQAEHQLRGANANIGAARAAFFPRISLTTSGGTASGSLDNLFADGSASWTFIPQIRLPIFEAGRLRASLDVAELQRDINIATYEKTIQTAFREVADALAERATVDEQLDARRRLVEASRASLRLSEARYREGLDNYLSYLDSQRNLYTAETQLIDTRLIEAINRIMLYRVLGGGAQ